MPRGLHAMPRFATYFWFYFARADAFTFAYFHGGLVYSSRADWLPINLSTSVLQ